MRHFEDMVTNGDWDEVEKYLSGFTKNLKLRTLINQSLNWQHQLCKNPKPNPDIKTLFVDHSCGQSQPNGAHALSPVTNPLMGAVPKAGGFPPLGAHGPFQPAQAALPTSIAGWMTNPSPVPHASASAGPIGFITANNPGTSSNLKRPRTSTNNAAVDYQTADSEHVLKRSRPFGMQGNLA
ncbi:Topless-related protein 4 [Camellia lanceoleosa]|uniref:Topless-related protein 4 n=1 Tax=Camellia lanceoleosa TaxID=1840588 RepID=A0ACC0IUA2_9ERIC|nr:Topless-related protein 4 [Camellia lanceoleosa]